MNSYPSQTHLVALLNYDPETGVFVWRARPGSRAWNTRNAGMTICACDSEGYLRIKIDGVRYQANRIAWIICKGSDTSLLIDHKDRDRSNNRIENLREATRAQNKANSGVSKTSKSGLKGAVPHAGGYMSQITVGGKTKYLGYFDTPEKAHAKWWEAAQANFGEFASSGAAETAIAEAKRALGKD